MPPTVSQFSANFLSSAKIGCSLKQANEWEAFLTAETSKNCYRTFAKEAWSTLRIMFLAPRRSRLGKVTSRNTKSSINLEIH